jgi:hypothetical protein
MYQSLPRLDQRRVTLRAVLRALVLLVIAAASCDGAPASYPRAPNVRIRALTEAQANAVGRTAGVEGDYVIAGGGLRVLVGGMERRSSERGRVLAVQASGAGASDDLERIAPVLAWRGRAREIGARSISVARIAGRAALLVESSARGRRVERYITIADAASTLAIYVTVGPGDGAISIGERVGWAGQPPFVPWVEDLDDGAWHDAEWIGTEGPRRSLALGSLARGAKVRGYFQSERGQRILRFTDLVARVPRDGGNVRMHLAVARGGLSFAVRRLGWARGQPFPEASVSLSSEPPDAAIRINDASERTWLRTRMPAVVTRVPLPRSDDPLYAHATAYGHPASDDVEIAPGQTLRLDLPLAGLLIASAIDESTGEPIPFRVRIDALPGTRKPDLGPIWAATGARSLAVSHGDALELSLPIGLYEVFITHGPEWSIDHRSVVITGVGATDIEAPLRRELDPGPYIACDFHLHSEPSPDSHVTLHDRIASLLAEGIGFAVPTDHNHVTDYRPTIRRMNMRLGTVPGVEVTTFAPAFGHFNAYPYPLDETRPGNGAPEFQGLTPAQMFAGIRAGAADVIVQVNHPRFEGGIGYFDETSFDAMAGAGGELYSDDYDVIEVWNGYDQRRPERVERNIAEWLAMLARGRRVVAVGNSDSHNLAFELAGYPRTYVAVDSFDPLAEPEEEVSMAPPLDAGVPLIDAGITAPPRAPISADARRLLDALRQGRVVVTNGPFLDVRIDGRGPGEHVAASERATVEVRVFAPEWMSADSIDLYAGATLVETIPIEPRTRRRRDPPGLRFDRRVEIPLGGAAFVVAVVRGEAPMDRMFPRRGIRPLAFTNPIWIDAPAP